MYFFTHARARVRRRKNTRCAWRAAVVFPSSDEGRGRTGRARVREINRDRRRRLICFVLIFVSVENWPGNWRWKLKFRERPAVARFFIAVVPPGRAGIVFATGWSPSVSRRARERFAADRPRVRTIKNPATEHVRSFRTAGAARQYRWRVPGRFGGSEIPAVPNLFHSTVVNLLKSHSPLPRIRVKVIVFFLWAAQIIHTN